VDKKKRKKKEKKKNKRHEMSFKKFGRRMTRYLYQLAFARARFRINLAISANYSGLRFQAQRGKIIKINWWIRRGWIKDNADRRFEVLVREEQGGRCAKCTKRTSAQQTRKFVA